MSGPNRCSVKHHQHQLSIPCASDGGHLTSKEWEVREGQVAGVGAARGTNLPVSSGQRSGPSQGRLAERVPCLPGVGQLRGARNTYSGTSMSAVPSG